MVSNISLSNNLKSTCSLHQLLYLNNYTWILWLKQNSYLDHQFLKAHWPIVASTTWIRSTSSLNWSIPRQELGVGLHEVVVDDHLTRIEDKVVGDFVDAAQRRFVEARTSVGVLLQVRPADASELKQEDIGLWHSWQSSCFLHHTTCGNMVLPLGTNLNNINNSNNS